MLRANKPAIAALVMGRKECAGNAILDRRQGRIGFGRAVAVERLDFAAFLAQDPALGGGRLEGGGVAVEIEKPALVAVIFDRRARQRLVEDRLRIIAEPRLALGVARRVLNRALLPEQPHPAPEGGIGARLEAQGLIVAPQRPQQDFGRGRR